MPIIGMPGGIMPGLGGIPMVGIPIGGIPGGIPIGGIPGGIPIGGIPGGIMPGLGGMPIGTEARLPVTGALAITTNDSFKDAPP